MNETNENKGLILIIPNCSLISPKNHDFKSSNKYHVGLEAVGSIYGERFLYIKDLGFVVYKPEKDAYFKISFESALNVISSSIASFTDPPKIDQICTPNFYKAFLDWFKTNYEVSLPHGSEDFVFFNNGVYNFKTKEFVEKSPKNFCMNVVNQEYRPEK